MKAYAQRLKQAALPLAIFVFVNALSIIYHEPWRDETQSWLLARELSLGELFAAMSAEGHPCLWFLLLAPLARLGASYWCVYAISLGSMLVVGYIFLTRSPFKRPVTLLCFFSGLFFYFLPVVARVYAIIPPLLMLLYALYPRRHEQPVRYAIVLALICQTHIIMCGFAGALMALWAIERVRMRGAEKRGRAFAALAIMLAGAALLFLTLRNSVNDNAIVSVREFGSPAELAGEAFRQTCELLRGINGVNLYARTGSQLLVMLPVYALALCALIMWLRGSPKQALVCAAALGWHVFINVFLYSTSVQRSLIALWTALFCVMTTARERGEAAQAAPRQALQRLTALLCGVMAALCATTLAQTIGAVREDADARTPYSCGRAAAGYIRDELPADALILLETENRMSSVTALLKSGMFYNLLRDNEHTFTVLDKGFINFAPEGDLDASLEKVKARYADRPLYLLTTLDAKERLAAMDAKSAATLELIYSWAGSNATNENYMLYSVLAAAE